MHCNVLLNYLCGRPKSLVYYYELEDDDRLLNYCCVEISFLCRPIYNTNWYTEQCHWTQKVTIAIVLKLAAV